MWLAVASARWAEAAVAAASKSEVETAIGPGIFRCCGIFLSLCFGQGRGGVFFPQIGPFQPPAEIHRPGEMGVAVRGDRQAAGRPFAGGRQLRQPTDEIAVEHDHQSGRGVRSGDLIRLEPVAGQLAGGLKGVVHGKFVSFGSCGPKKSHFGGVFAGKAGAQ